MITDRNSAAVLLQGQPYIQYTAKLQYNSKGTHMQHPLIGGKGVGGGKRGGSYTSRVQSEKDTFLAVTVFYHHSLFTYGSQEKAFVN
jgi:hypothetical protein